MNHRHRPRFPWILVLALAAAVASLIWKLALVSPPRTNRVMEVEPTPERLADAESIVYREIAPGPLRLHVFRPSEGSAATRRPAFMVFFGGDWARGTPLHVSDWTRWAAAKLAMVGIAPDYRTASRFGSTPRDAVADARFALRWVQEHSAELGVDPEKVVVGGHSVGGHLALWTAIPEFSGEPAGGRPLFRPRALILTSPVSDTSAATGYGAERLGNDAAALSPLPHLDAQMPPMLIFHGDADRIVPHVQSARLRHALAERGNACELVTVPRGTHNFGSEMPAWQEKIRERIESFLREQGVLPDLRSINARSAAP